MSAVTEQIDFGDPRGLTDLSTFIGRARVAVPDGAIRLQVPGRGLLVVTVAVLEGSGLLGDGTVLGLRAVRVRDATPGIDATVAFASITDRVARHRGTGTTLSVPPTTAERGIAEVAEGTPDGAGGAAVTALRRRVWGAMTRTVPPIAAGLAFGAHVLGFLRDGESTVVATCGRWTRLSTSRGHVLVR